MSNLIEKIPVQTVLWTSCDGKSHSYKVDDFNRDKINEIVDQVNALTVLAEEQAEFNKRVRNTFKYVQPKEGE